VVDDEGVDDDDGAVVVCRVDEELVDDIAALVFVGIVGIEIVGIEIVGVEVIVIEGSWRRSRFAIT
jgi:hypothetical protein